MSFKTRSALAMTPTLAIIIGRSGSKGLPGKNSTMIDGRPIVSYSIDDAIGSTHVDRAIVSTDDTEVAAASVDLGIELIKRPAHLAGDEATVCAVVQDTIDRSRSLHEVVVILYACCPVRPVDLVDQAIEMLVRTGADSVQSYTSVGSCHPMWMSRIDEEGRVEPFIPNAVDRRQDLPPLHVVNGGIIVARREQIMAADGSDPHAFLGTDRRAITLEPGEVIDIDSASDLKVATLLIEHGQYRARRVSQA